MMHDPNQATSFNGAHWALGSQFVDDDDSDDLISIDDVVWNDHSVGGDDDD